MKNQYEKVMGIANYKIPSYWSWKFPFYHKSTDSIAYFTKTGVYQYTFKKGHEPLAKVKRRYKKKHAK